MIVNLLPGSCLYVKILQNDSHLSNKKCSMWQNIFATVWINKQNQVSPGESYDPLLMSLVTSTSISVEETEGAG
jgi:hypothetical protein